MDSFFKNRKDMGMENPHSTVASMLVAGYEEKGT